MEWLLPETVTFLHDRLAADHGGVAGLRDADLLLSALARPRQRAACEGLDLAAVAALHAVALVRNHPFADANKRTGFATANKRTGFATMGTFLALNGAELEAGEDAAVEAMVVLDAGTMAEDDFIAWVRDRARPRA